MARLLIGVGLLVWILLAILAALFVARMIRLRDRDSQHPDRTVRASISGADDTESSRAYPEGKRGRKRLAILRRGRP